MAVRTHTDREGSDEARADHRVQDALLGPLTLDGQTKDERGHRTIRQSSRMEQASNYLTLKRSFIPSEDVGILDGLQVYIMCVHTGVIFLRTVQPIGQGSYRSTQSVILTISTI